MNNARLLRYSIIAALLLVGVGLSAYDASSGSADYPGGRFLADADWLRGELNSGREDLVVLDVRTDEHYDNACIPGAVRLPWRYFRHSKTALELGGIFVGTSQAQSILGRHGVARGDTVVLYDDVERDGGATASYVFWVLDLLGHERMKVLEGGIEAWKAAGGETATAPAEPEPILYQAPVDEMRLRAQVDAAYIYDRLGDPFYQIIDVRSRPEYLGETPNTGLDGSVLKLGHIPTAYNVHYEANWVDAETKRIKPYEELLALYGGLDPNKATVTYCHSARRGSFGYFILRLMGYSDPILYDNSWFEWGNEERFYPVQTRAVPLPEGGGARVSQTASTGSGNAAGGSASGATGGSSGGATGGSGSSDGYVSCGG